VQDGLNQDGPVMPLPGRGNSGQDEEKTEYSTMEYTFFSNLKEFTKQLICLDGQERSL